MDRRVETYKGLWERSLLAIGAVGSVLRPTQMCNPRLYAEKTCMTTNRSRCVNQVNCALEIRARALLVGCSNAAMGSTFMIMSPTYAPEESAKPAIIYAGLGPVGLLLARW
jgi:hypothetical protein